MSFWIIRSTAQILLRESSPYFLLAGNILSFPGVLSYCKLTLFRILSTLPHSRLSLPRISYHWANHSSLIGLSLQPAQCDPPLIGQQDRPGIESKALFKWSTSANRLTYLVQPFTFALFVVSYSRTTLSKQLYEYPWNHSDATTLCNNLKFVFSIITASVSAVQATVGGEIVQIIEEAKNPFSYAFYMRYYGSCYWTYSSA